MSIEVGAAAAEVAKEAAKEAAKEGIKEAAKETAKAAGKELSNKAVDVTKRIDISDFVKSNSEYKVDITKRLIVEGPEIATKDIPELIKDYLSELKDKCAFPDTLADKTLKQDELNPQIPERIKELRKEFNSSSFKDKLIREWEETTGKEWPKYKEDLLNQGGIPIRIAGQRYDAHHIQPLELGGSNIASNITPIECNAHSSLHFDQGNSYKKLVNAVKGVERL